MNPFIKIEWEDVVENFTPERVKRVKAYFQKKYNTSHVQVITKTLVNNKNTKLKTLEVTDNILDPLYQKTLMKDFLTENKVDIAWEMVDRLDNRVNSEIDKTKQNTIRYNKWFIKKVEFSNFLSFGNDNVIDFTALDGITVIESNPRNFGGKSTSSVDLLMFLFFNSTTKTKTNAEIFNKFTEEDVVTVKGYLTIDGGDYVISRTLSRKKSKAGEFNVKSELEFYKDNGDGTLENLTGEQRRETETFIASAIGTEEDFLSTILTTGYNLEELIESKPTARGQILTKFLGLESLKQKEEICKEIYTDWSRKLVGNTYNIVQLKSDIEVYETNINDSKDIIANNEKLLAEYADRQSSLENRKELILSLRSNDIDQELIRTNPTTVQKEIDDLNNQKQLSQKNADDINVVEPSKFYNEEQHKELKDQMSNLQGIDAAYKYTKSDKEKLIKQLTEGTICPTCKRALEDVDHTGEIESLKAEVTDIINKTIENQAQYDLLKEQSNSFEQLKSEFDNYERNKLRKERHLLEIEQKQHEINLRNTKLQNYENGRKKLEENQKIDAELMTLRTKIETVNGDIRVSNTLIERNKNSIDSMREKISTNNDLITKIKAEEELQAVFKIYLSVYGKNGISKVILKNMIPLINQELHRLLVDSCYFILELNINEKNEVDFIMIDSETRVVKGLNAGSGYERTISSLALRSVLTKISSLPKPNIVVMDEVFGKIADENLELVGEFFKKIKNYFEHIFVISHNPLIRNWSDNLIMVKKEENVSSIDYISTKIS
jgi:DNA repair exonuclease SbcCD ATPase subunit